MHLVRSGNFCTHAYMLDVPYKKVPKDSKRVRLNRAQLGGCMTKGYVIVEALGFCTEYMQEYTITTRRVSDDKENLSMYDEILEGGERMCRLPPDIQEWIYMFMVNNAAPLEEWRRWVHVRGEELVVHPLSYNNTPFHTLSLQIYAIVIVLSDILQSRVMMWLST